MVSAGTTIVSPGLKNEILIVPVSKHNIVIAGLKFDLDFCPLPNEK